MDPLNTHQEGPRTDWELEIARSYPTFCQKHMSILTGGLKESEYLSVQGNVTHLGIKQKIAPPNEYAKADFLTHYDGPKHISHNSIGQQLRMSRSFKRPITSIDSTLTEQAQAYQAEKAHRKDAEAKMRYEQSLSRSQRSGFNLITGEVVGNGPKSSRPHTKYLPSGLGPESQHRGMRMMADSSNRYFTPQFSGESHWQRQRTLQTEGLSHPRMAGVIKVGTAESPSHGVEDQFSKSCYMTRAAPLEGKACLVSYTH